MRNIYPYVTALFVTLASTACSTTSDSAPSSFDPDAALVADAGPDATGRSCTSDTSCPSGYGCGYATGDGCTATGSCQPLAAGACLGTTLCACNGTTTLSCTFVGGYAATPVALPLASTCADDAGPTTDGSAPDASVDAGGASDASGE